MRKTGESETCEFRWDVEIPEGEKRYGQRFMRQWKRVLQQQRLTPLVSSKVAPCHARFQLCVDGKPGGATEGITVGEKESHKESHGEQNRTEQIAGEILEELGRLRWSNDAPTHSANIARETVGKVPAGFQGVRVWMTFAREDVEAVLTRKPKI